MALAREKALLERRHFLPDKLARVSQKLVEKHFQPTLSKKQAYAGPPSRPSTGGLCQVAARVAFSSKWCASSFQAQDLARPTQLAAFDALRRVYPVSSQRPVQALAAGSFLRSLAVEKVSSQRPLPDPCNHPHWHKQTGALSPGFGRGSRRYFFLTRFKPLARSRQGNSSIVRTMCLRLWFQAAGPFLTNITSF
jgi:hypothetical protein